MTKASLTLVKIADIQVGNRHRKDYGDIAALVGSIRELGLLQPIAVNPDGVLVAGERRLEAVKLLGWTEIPAHVVANLEEAGLLLKAERDENTQRKDFTPSELVAVAADLEPLERAAAKERQRKSGGPNPGSVKFSEPQALDKVASALGVSRPTLAKAQAVVEAAKVEPERFAALVTEMDRTGRVDGVYRKLQQAQKRVKRVEQAAYIGRAELKPSPVLYAARAESLPIASESVDVIITSPPYNLGEEEWPMGGEGRTPRDAGIGYEDTMPELEYELWQVQVFCELYRVAKPGASFFYNHKVRQRHGRLIHPMDWLRHDNPWTLRQEIIWDRGSTHNHSPALFWPEDERIYWMTKGRPIIPEGGIGQPTVWRFFGPLPNTWHPAPFCAELPKRCLQAVGRPGITVLDPFGGSMTTCEVALAMGYNAIGVDLRPEYIERAKRERGWT